MLKTINDYISFGVLIILTIYSIRICIGAFISSNNQGETYRNRHEILNDYINNEED